MRLIDADRLLHKLEKRRNHLKQEYAEHGALYLPVQSILESEHVSEVVEKMAQDGVDPMKHGRWVSRDYDDFSIRCSVCHDYFTMPESRSDCDPVVDFGLKYCPNCGAKMDEVSEGERREPQET